MNRSIISALALLLAVSASRADKPPANMQEHFRWCAAAEAVSELIARYESFWREYLPAYEGGVPKGDRDDGYGDAPHVIHVRLCAYRLLQLHIDARNYDRAAYFARWLEGTDPVSGVKPTKIPQQPAK